MATVAHHIISTYHADDRQRLEIETGQLQISESYASTSLSGLNSSGYDDITGITRIQNEEDETIENLWQTEKATFGLSRRILRPPKFVPASSAYTSFENNGGYGDADVVEVEETREDDIGSWYRSLSRRTNDTQNLFAKATLPQSPKFSPSSLTKPKPARDKNTWFISRSLPASTSSTPQPQESLTSTLSRTLPPSPSPDEAGEMNLSREKPPVFLAIGPWNKGYQMLNKYGWEEGEALGLGVKRRGLGYKKGVKGNFNEDETIQNVQLSTGMNKEDAIDLTLSDSELISNDDETIFLQDQYIQHVSSNAEELSTEAISNDYDHDHDRGHGSLALITPLRATLKSDRLGIGLKPKSRHKQFSDKAGSSEIIGRRLRPHHTHQHHRPPKSRPQIPAPTPAQMHGEALFRASFRNAPLTDSDSTAAHTARTKSTLLSVSQREKERKLKDVYGRGRRGFERAKKREEGHRRGLLAHLNAD